MSYVSMTIYNILFIYYCLYCLHHNLFPYIVSLYCISNQGKSIVKTGGSCIILSDAIQNTVFSLAKIHDNTTEIYVISTDNVFLPS